MSIFNDKIMSKIKNVFHMKESLVMTPHYPPWMNKKNQEYF